MKKSMMMVFAAMLAAAGMALAQSRDLAVLALKDAVEDARASLAGATKIPAGEPVAILPISDDADARIAGLLKNALVAAGKTCVEGKEDPMWESILKEIEWDERKEDILDPATLDKFGKLKSAKYLLYGCVRRLAGDERYVLMEIELHCSCVATKEHVWGGSFVRRHYAPDADPDGRIEIPDEIREALVKGIRDEIAKSLASSKKLGTAKKVALLPVFGDVDQYTKGLFRDVLSASSVTPVNLDVATRAEARFALREGAKLADALAYGIFRDIGASLIETKAGGEKIYRARMEMQLWIEKGASREILWSDTVRFSKEFSLGPRGWWDKFCRFFPWLGGNPALMGVLAIVVVLGVIFLIFVLPKMIRVR